MGQKIEAADLEVIKKVVREVVTDVFNSYNHEVKRAIEAKFTAENDLQEAHTEAIIEMRREISILNKIFGHATREIEKRGK